MAFAILSSAFRAPAIAATSVPSTTSEGSAQASKNRGTVQSPDLGPLLAKTAEYCRKLESVAFYFICREEITEAIDPSLDALDGWTLRPTNRTVFGSPRKQDIKNSYVYDYQCIRAGRATREVRTLLKENGKEKNEPNAELKTSVVVFGTVLMGPVGLFGERFQPEYDYTVIGQDKIGKIKVLVIEARPKPGAPESRNLYGKAWIDPATGDILRIDWSDSRIGRFDIFEERGKRYKRKPRLSIRSEFSAEKNGIRFPSRLFVEEAYLNVGGSPQVRSITDVRYKDFKFFKVSVEISY